jgi:hypothetical protein
MIQELERNRPVDDDPADADGDTVSVTVGAVRVAEPGHQIALIKDLRTSA